MKRIISSLCLFCIFTTSIHLQADCCVESCAVDECGCAYEDCRTAPSITPQCAIGTLALVATIAILIHHRSNYHHGHAHSASK